MSEDSGFQWDRDEADEAEAGPLPKGPGPQMSDAKAMLEAKKQLAAEGYKVDGFNDDEDDQQEEELSEEDFEQEEEAEEEDAATALIARIQGPDQATRNVLEEAKIRLEKAKLYEMIMKADIFDEVDADPRAIAKVRDEFNAFGKERLEILLGMKQEKQEQQQVIEQVYYPAHDLNEMEVLAIKDLAAKLTGGESLAAGSPQPQVVATPVKKQGLKSLRTAPQVQQRQPAPQQQRQRQPLVKERNQNRPAPKQIKKKNGEVKQVHEMNEQELRERSKQVRSAPKGMPVQRPLPMPDSDTMAWGGGAQAGDARGGAGGQNLTSLLARALGATNVEDVGNGD